MRGGGGGVAGAGIRALRWMGPVLSGVPCIFHCGRILGELKGSRKAKRYRRPCACWTRTSWAGLWLEVMAVIYWGPLPGFQPRGPVGTSATVGASPRPGSWRQMTLLGDRRSLPVAGCLATARGWALGTCWVRAVVFLPSSGGFVLELRAVFTVDPTGTKQDSKHTCCIFKEKGIWACIFGTFFTQTHPFHFLTAPHPTFIPRSKKINMLNPTQQGPFRSSHGRASDAHRQFPSRKSIALPHPQPVAGDGP